MQKTPPYVVSEYIAGESCAALSNVDLEANIQSSVGWVKQSETHQYQVNVFQSNISSGNENKANAEFVILDDAIERLNIHHCAGCYAANFCGEHNKTVGLAH